MSARTPHTEYMELRAEFQAFTERLGVLQAQMIQTIQAHETRIAFLERQLKREMPTIQVVTS